MNKVTSKRSLRLCLNKVQVTRFKQSGQVIIILLLVMLVALSVGLALTQRSVTDVTTSTQVEQATRAFSAAEAGIQKALSSPLPSGLLTLDNNSSVTVNSSDWLPYATNVGIEYPKIGRETTAQFWFIDPAVAGVPVAYYTNHSFDLFFGNAATTDLPAVEVAVVMQSGSNFYTQFFYYDSSSARTSLGNPNRNYFLPTSIPCNTKTMASGILGNNRTFFCQQTIGPVLDQGVGPGSCVVPTCKLILARVRFLYITENHSLALFPSPGQRLPPQVQIYSATGTAGQSQKQIQAFKVKDVVLPWFDFALFSTNELIK